MPPLQLDSKPGKTGEVFPAHSKSFQKLKEGLEKARSLLEGKRQTYYGTDEYAQHPAGTPYDEGLNTIDQLLHTSSSTFWQGLALTGKLELHFKDAETAGIFSASLQGIPGVFLRAVPPESNAFLPADHHELVVKLSPAAKSYFGSIHDNPLAISTDIDSTPAVSKKGPTSDPGLAAINAQLQSRLQSYYSLFGPDLQPYSIEAGFAAQNQATMDQLSGKAPLAPQEQPNGLYTNAASLKATLSTLQTESERNEFLTDQALRVKALEPVFRYQRAEGYLSGNRPLTADSSPEARNNVGIWLTGLVTSTNQLASQFDVQETNFRKYLFSSGNTAEALNTQMKNNSLPALNKDGQAQIAALKDGEGLYIDISGKAYYFEKNRQKLDVYTADRDALVDAIQKVGLLKDIRNRAVELEKQLSTSTSSTSLIGACHSLKSDYAELASKISEDEYWKNAPMTWFGLKIPDNALGDVYRFTARHINTIESIDAAITSAVLPPLGSTMFAYIGSKGVARGIADGNVGEIILGGVMMVPMAGRLAAEAGAGKNLMKAIGFVEGSSAAYFTYDMTKSTIQMISRASRTYCTFDDIVEIGGSVAMIAGIPLATRALEGVKVRKLAKEAAHKTAEAVSKASTKVIDAVAPEGLVPEGALAMSVLPMPLKSRAPKLLDCNSVDLSIDPLAKSVYKKPVVLKYEFATADQMVKTSEGIVRAKAGDAILTDAKGRRWPLARENFEATYELNESSPGRATKKKMPVLARQMDVPFTVNVSGKGDPLVGKPGDWLVQYGEGDFGIVNQGTFKQTYARADAKIIQLSPPTSPPKYIAFHDVTGDILIGRVLATKEDGSYKLSMADGSVKDVSQKRIESYLKSYNQVLPSLTKAQKISLSTEILIPNDAINLHIKKHVIGDPYDEPTGSQVNQILQYEPEWWNVLSAKHQLDPEHYYPAMARELWAHAVSGDDPSIQAVYERDKGLNKLVLFKPIEIDGEHLLMVGIYSLRTAREMGKQVTMLTLFLTPESADQNVYENCIPVQFQRTADGVHLQYDPFYGSYPNLGAYVRAQLYGAPPSEAPISQITRMRMERQSTIDQFIKDSPHVQALDLQIAELNKERQSVIEQSSKSSPPAHALSVQIEELRKQRAALIAQFTQDSPQVRELNRQITQAVKNEEMKKTPPAAQAPEARKSSADSPVIPEPELESENLTWTRPSKKSSSKSTAPSPVSGQLAAEWGSNPPIPISSSSLSAAGSLRPVCQTLLDLGIQPLVAGSKSKGPILLLNFDELSAFNQEHVLTGIHLRSAKWASTGQGPHLVVFGLDRDGVFKPKFATAIVSYFNYQGPIDPAADWSSNSLLTGPINISKFRSGIINNPAAGRLLARSTYLQELFSQAGGLRPSADKSGAPVAVIKNAALKAKIVLEISSSQLRAEQMPALLSFLQSIGDSKYELEVLQHLIASNATVLAQSPVLLERLASSLLDSPSNILDKVITPELNHPLWIPMAERVQVQAPELAGVPAADLAGILSSVGGGGKWRTSNPFAVMRELESAHPGAVAALYENFGIAQFGRYDLQTLSTLYTQMEHPDPSKPNLFMLMPAVDSNPGTSGVFGRIGALAPTLAERYNVWIVEAASKREAARRFLTAAQMAGGKGAFSSVLLFGHGDGKELELGGTGVQNAALGTEDFLNSPSILGYLAPNPTVVLGSCSQGKPRGMADQISTAYPSLRIYSNREPTYILSMRPGFDTQGQPLFDIKWVNSKQERVWARGEIESKPHPRKSAGKKIKLRPRPALTWSAEGEPDAAKEDATTPPPKAVNENSPQLQAAFNKPIEPDPTKPTAVAKDQSQFPNTVADSYLWLAEHLPASWNERPPPLQYDLPFKTAQDYVNEFSPHLQPLGYSLKLNEVNPEFIDILPISGGGRLSVNAKDVGETIRDLIGPSAIDYYNQLLSQRKALPEGSRELKELDTRIEAAKKSVVALTLPTSPELGVAPDIKPGTTVMMAPRDAREPSDVSSQSNATSDNPLVCQYVQIRYWGSQTMARVQSAIEFSPELTLKSGASTKLSPTISGYLVELPDGSQQQINSTTILSPLEDYNRLRLHLEGAEAYPLFPTPDVPPEFLAVNLNNHVNYDPANAVENANRQKLKTESGWFTQLAKPYGISPQEYYTLKSSDMWTQAANGNPDIQLYYQRYNGRNIVIAIEPVQAGDQSLLMVGTYQIKPTKAKYETPRQPCVFASLFLTPLSDPSSLWHFSDCVPVQIKMKNGQPQLDYNPFDGSIPNLGLHIEENLAPALQAFNSARAALSQEFTNLLQVRYDAAAEYGENSSQVKEIQGHMDEIEKKLEAFNRPGAWLQGPPAEAVPSPRPAPAQVAPTPAPARPSAVEPTAAPSVDAPPASREAPEQISAVSVNAPPLSAPSITSRLQSLQEAGFKTEESQKLVSDNFFQSQHSDAWFGEMKERVNSLAALYNCPEAKIREVILSQPSFANFDHASQLKKEMDVYGAENEEKIKRANLSHPPFAGLDHVRVLNQLSRFGRMAGFNEKEVKDLILNNPVVAGYSTQRYLAAFDVGRALAAEGVPNNQAMARAFLSYISKSPYVPDTPQLSITKAGRQGYAPSEPPLMGKLRTAASSLKPDAHAYFQENLLNAPAFTDLNEAFRWLANYSSQKPPAERYSLGYLIKALSSGDKIPANKLKSWSMEATRADYALDMKEPVCDALVNAMLSANADGHPKVWKSYLDVNLFPSQKDPGKPISHAYAASIAKYAIELYGPEIIERLKAPTGLGAKALRQRFRLDTVQASSTSLKLDATLAEQYAQENKGAVAGAIYEAVLKSLNPESGGRNWTSYLDRRKFMNKINGSIPLSPPSIRSVSNIALSLYGPEILERLNKTAHVDAQTLSQHSGTASLLRHLPTALPNASPQSAPASHVPESVSHPAPSAPVDLSLEQYSKSYALDFKELVSSSIYRALLTAAQSNDQQDWSTYVTSADFPSRRDASRPVSIQQANGIALSALDLYGNEIIERLKAQTGLTESELSQIPGLASLQPYLSSAEPAPAPKSVEQTPTSKPAEPAPKTTADIIEEFKPQVLTLVYKIRPSKSDPNSVELYNASEPTMTVEASKLGERLEQIRQADDMGLMLNFQPNGTNVFLAYTNGSPVSLGVIPTEQVPALLEQGSIYLSKFPDLAFERDDVLPSLDELNYSYLSWRDKNQGLGLLDFFQALNAQPVPHHMLEHLPLFTQSLQNDFQGLMLDPDHIPIRRIATNFVYQMQALSSDNASHVLYAKFRSVYEDALAIKVDEWFGDYHTYQVAPFGPMGLEQAGQGVVVESLLSMGPADNDSGPNIVPGGAMHSKFVDEMGEQMAGNLFKRLSDTHMRNYLISPDGSVERIDHQGFGNSKAASLRALLPYFKKGFFSPQDIGQMQESFKAKWDQLREQYTLHRDDILKVYEDFLSDPQAAEQLARTSVLYLENPEQIINTFDQSMVMNAQHAWEVFQNGN